MGKKWTEDVVKQFVHNNSNSEYVSHEYIAGKKILMHLKCECESNYDVRLDHFQGGHSRKCNNCTFKEKIKNEQRSSYDKILELVDKKGYELLTSFDEYDGTKSRITLKTKEGYLINPLVTSFINNIQATFSTKNKFSIYNINKYIENNKLNIILKDSDFTGVDSYLKYQYKDCNHDFNMNIYELTSNDIKLCKTCEKIKKNIILKKRIKIKDLKELNIFKTHKVKIKCNEQLIRDFCDLKQYKIIEINNFNSYQSKITIKTNINYLYRNTVHNLMKLKNINIAVFNKNNPYVIENIKTWLKNNNKNFELITNNYIDSKQLLGFKCLKCGEVRYGYWTYISLANNLVCSSNCKILRNDNVILERYRKMFEDNSCTLFNISRSNGRVYLHFEDSQKYKYKINASKVKDFKCIKQYSKSNPYTIENIRNYLKINKIDYELLSNVYINSITNLRWKCPKGHEFECNWNKFYSSNQRCAECNISKGEYFIDQYLIKNNINYLRQYRIKECKNKKPLPFDFAIFEDNKKTKLLHLIEYQGLQHYVAMGYWGGNEKLLRQQKTDNIKVNYCINNKINLIQIPYWEINNVQLILDNVLK